MQPQDFLRMGIAAIPCTLGTKRPRVRWQKYQSKLPTEHDLNVWSSRPTNWAVVCGWNGLTVIDCDTLADYIAWQAWAMAQGDTARDIALRSYKVKTARGVHVYVLLEDCPRTGHFRWGDIKARGGYVMIPPSVHPSGARYEAVNPTAPILRAASLDQLIPDPPIPAVQIPPTINVFASSSLWPQTIIEEIKERISILSLLGDVQKTGDHWYMTRCPLHQDENPSMWVDSAKGICRCYTGCNGGKALDIISLYAAMNGLSNKAAIRQLAARL